MLIKLYLCNFEIQYSYITERVFCKLQIKGKLVLFVRVTFNSKKFACLGYTFTSLTRLSNANLHSKNTHVFLK